MSDLRRKDLRWWAMTLGVPAVGLVILVALEPRQRAMVVPQDSIAGTRTGVIWTTDGDGGRIGTAP